MRFTERALCTFIFLLLTSVATQLHAQSHEISAPAPISTSEVIGRIIARDLGDSRLTDHYYTFVANPGDLEITVQSKNLNGDVDVFSAVGLRPLLKVTVYAESTSPISKSIFLRRREELILRVEARTPNDDDGSYHLRFGGSFEPLAGGPLLADAGNPTNESDTATRSTARTGRRVSSVGARINEPEPPAEEVASTAKTDATPEPSPAEATESKPAKAEAAKTGAPRVPIYRRPSTRRRPRPTATVRPTEEPAPASPSERAVEETATVANPPAASRRSSSRRGSTRPTESPVEVPESGPRLVIETADGTLVNRAMSTVRRVTIEEGLIVILGRDQKVQRIPLASVVRMSIEP